MTLWEVATGKEQLTLVAHQNGIRSLAFAPDDRTLASGCESGEFKLWNVATGR